MEHRMGERGPSGRRLFQGYVNGSGRRLRRGCRRSLTALFLFASSLLAEPADWIWTARYVITEDAQRRVIENGAVAIRGDRIAGVGTKAEINTRFQSKQRLDRS